MFLILQAEIESKEFLLVIEYVNSEISSLKGKLKSPLLTQFYGTVNISSILSFYNRGFTHILFDHHCRLSQDTVQASRFFAIRRTKYANL
jgi:hypothetical protein